MEKIATSLGIPYPCSHREQENGKKIGTEGRGIGKKGEGREIEDREKWVGHILWLCSVR